MITLPPGGTENGLTIVGPGPATVTVSLQSLSTDSGYTLDGGWKVTVVSGNLNGAIVIATGRSNAVFEIDPSPNIPVPDQHASWQPLGTSDGQVVGTRKATLVNPSNPFYLALGVQV